MDVRPGVCELPAMGAVAVQHPEVALGRAVGDLSRDAPGRRGGRKAGLGLRGGWRRGCGGRREGRPGACRAGSEEQETRDGEPPSSLWRGRGRRITAHQARGTHRSPSHALHTSTWLRRFHHSPRLRPNGDRGPECALFTHNGSKTGRRAAGNGMRGRAARTRHRGVPSFIE
jgi:hypothetical protein